jgi:hypothetical protein
MSSREENWRGARAFMPAPEVVEAAMGRGVRRALAIHRALGVPVATWRDGHVVIVQPRDLPELETEPESADPNP